MNERQRAAVQEARKCLTAAALLADGFDRPATAAVFRQAEEGLSAILDERNGLPSDAPTEQE